MNQIKPYLFWYVCGALFLVLIVLAFLLTPTVDLDGASHDATSIKGQLDGQIEKLKTLQAKAKNGSPQLVYDPENKKDFDDLRSKYLINEKWRQAISPVVKGQQDQYRAIREELVRRSERLHQPVADSGDISSWYTAYENATVKLLQSLRDANALAMPSQAAAPATDPLKSSDEVRRVAGFFTKGEIFPPANEHPRLTLRLRIMEALIGEVLLKAKGKVEINPAAPPLNREGSADTQRSDLGSHGVALAMVDWQEAGGADKALAPPVGDYGAAHRLRVTLHGAEAALTAAMAAVEAMESPLAIVAGATLQRREGWKSGERRRSEERLVLPAELVLDLAILDFSAFPEQPLSARPAPAANTKGRPR